MALRKPNPNPTPPPKIGSPEFRALKDLWYKKLEESGFRDLESGGARSTWNRDKYGAHLSRPHPSGARRVFVNIDGIPADELQSAMAAPPEGQRYWELAADAVHALPERSRFKAIFLVICETGNVETTIRRLARDEKKAHAAWVKLMVKAGLK